MMMKKNNRDRDHNHDDKNNIADIDDIDDEDVDNMYFI